MGSVIIFAIQFGIAAGAEMMHFSFKEISFFILLYFEACVCSISSHEPVSVCSVMSLYRITV